MKILFSGKKLKTARNYKNSLTWLVGTLWVLTLLGLALPEWVELNNRLITTITQTQFPPENVQKSDVTNGITRDFVLLRSSISAETINPRSPFLFVLVHITFVLLSILGIGSIGINLKVRSNQRL